ncbi:hypothetical protein V6N13_085937 [Hibiscus sabdariffa]|uniref:Uncharacterized protein n=1 Tax=Hibiscus sabdariffa TaxID=183260 RepID=A0ABR2FRV7_9ROSI
MKASSSARSSNSKSIDHLYMFLSGINLLSLFSGIGGAEVVFHQLDISLKNVVSVEMSEVNRHIILNWRKGKKYAAINENLRFLVKKLLLGCTKAQGKWIKIVLVVMLIILTGILKMNWKLIIMPSLAQVYHLPMGKLFWAQQR